MNIEMDMHHLRLPVFDPDPIARNAMDPPRDSTVETYIPFNIAAGRQEFDELWILEGMRPVIALNRLIQGYNPTH